MAREHPYAPASPTVDDADAVGVLDLKGAVCPALLRGPRRVDIWMDIE